MDHKFKVEIMIEEEKVLADSEYDLKDMYQAIIDVFKENDIPRIKSDDKRMLVFGTKKKEKYSLMRIAILRIIKSEIMPYLKHFKWYNNETGESDDMSISNKKKEIRLKSKEKTHEKVQYRFEVEIVINEEQVLIDNEYDLYDMYRAITSVFEENTITRLKSSKENMLTFGTQEHDKFAKIMLSINRVCFSEAKPYLKKVTWYNFENGSVENVLATFKREGLL